MSSQKKTPKKVDLALYKATEMSLPNVKEFQKKYPDWQMYNTAIYLNDYRVSGIYTVNLQKIYKHSRTGHSLIDTKRILHALNIPQHIIDQIEFEED